MLAPITGSPEAVRLLADRLATGGARLAAMAGVLGPLRDGAVWDGPAGEAFGQRVLAVPAVWATSARPRSGAARSQARQRAACVRSASGVRADRATHRAAPSTPDGTTSGAGASSRTA